MKKSDLRKVILFLSGQTVSLLGSALVQYTIGWYITLTTQSGVMTTIATVCGFLPQVVISLFAGVWADRFDRRKLMVMADGMIAVATMILAILFSVGYDQVWLLFVMSIIRSLGAGIQTPAVGAFLPEIVPAEKLMKVNGINASIQGAIMLIAPVAAGGLYNFMGMGVIFWIDVITAAIGISLLLMIKVRPRVEEKKEEVRIWEDMLVGMRYVKKTKWLRQLLMFYLAYALMFGPVMFLTPLMVARSFGSEAWRLVAHELAFAVGMTAGGLLVGVVAGKVKNKVVMLIGASVAFGFLTFVMGWSMNFWFYLGVMLPMGMTAPFINTGSMTVIQTRVKKELMGRVLSLVMIIGSSMIPLSMVIFGPIADVVAIEKLLIVTGILMLGIALFTLRCKELLEAGKLA